jgi:hypothetical protein
LYSHRQVPREEAYICVHMGNHKVVLLPGLLGPFRHLDRVGYNLLWDLHKQEKKGAMIVNIVQVDESKG